jgi:hypothetical protein
MDYLHGDVIDEEFEAACHYEYSRESTILREAAIAVARRKRKNINLAQEVAHGIWKKYNCGTWFVGYPWGFIWRCPSFPGIPWNRLGTRERRFVVSCFRQPTDSHCTRHPSKYSIP